MNNPIFISCGVAACPIGCVEEANVAPPFEVASTSARAVPTAKAKFPHDSYRVSCGGRDDRRPTLSAIRLGSLKPRKNPLFPRVHEWAASLHRRSQFCASPIPPLE